jgi:protein-disulfide isomerase
MTRHQIHSLFDLFSTVAMGLAAVAVVWHMFWRPDPSVGPESDPRVAVEDLRDRNLTTTIDGTFTKGNKNASIVLIEFGDFQCPFCARYAQETFGELERAFVARGTVQYAFRNFPLESLHSAALPAARAAECAGRQGRFWEMRALLYAKQTELDKQIWLSEAAELGLVIDQFQTCLLSELDPKIRADLEEGRRLGVASTPTFLIGQKSADGTVRLLSMIRGARPYAVFDDALGEYLKTQAALLEEPSSVHGWAIRR